MAQTPTTKTFVDVADIQGSLVLLKDGSLRSVISVESVNFDLKSSDEQIGIIRGFQDFLNALDFPLQIVVRSRKLDLKGYLVMLDEAATRIQNELLGIQLGEYRKFIKALSELANIMSKSFFVVVPYHAVEAVKSDSHGVRGKIKDLFAASKHAKKLTQVDLLKYEGQIGQRVSLVMAGLVPLGLKARLMADKELHNLYYGYYNPGQNIR